MYQDAGASPVGFAQACGWTFHRGAAATMFRLCIDGCGLVGLWICDGRRFVDLTDGHAAGGAAW